MASHLEINNISQSIRNSLINRNIGEKNIPINTDTLNSPIDLSYSNLTPKDKKRNNYVNYQDYIKDVYGSDSSLINILGGIVNGDSVNLRLTDSGLGVVSNFDIRSSIAGRIITTATGYDTPLGVFGGKAAGIAMFNGILTRAERLASKTVNNFISKVLGKETNEYSVYDNSITIDPDKNVNLLGITINADTVNTFEDILGINIDPLERGKFSVNASIFNEELDNLRSDITANQYLINSTGKHTRTLIYETLNRNLFQPNYGNSKDINLTLNDYLTSNSLTLNNSETLKSGNVYHTWNNDGLYTGNSPSDNAMTVFSDINNDNFQTNTYINTTLKGKQSNGKLKTILDKTNELFYNNKIKTIVSNFYNVDLETDSDITQTAYTKIGDKKIISKGRNLTNSSKTGNTNGYDDPFCRVWSWHKQYKTFADTLRNGNTNDLNSNQNVSPFLINNKKTLFLSKSVLDRDTNTVQIAPYNNSKLKNFMFSIENMAWKNLTQADIRDIAQDPKLNDNEIGPNNGRIMWFPPYDIKFNESSNVSVERNLFIGRGEPVYTYTNTERTGRLSFKLVVDHPSIINYYQAKDNSDTTTDNEENELLRFFAGCGILNIKSIQEEAVVTAPVQIKKEIKKPEYKETKLVSIYFPNDYSGIDEGSGLLRGSNTMQYLYSGLGQENTGGGGYENIIGTGLSPVSLECSMTNQNNAVATILDRNQYEIINYGGDVRQYKRDLLSHYDKNSKNNEHLPRLKYSYVNYYDITSYGLNNKNGVNKYSFRKLYESINTLDSDYDVINDLLQNAESITIIGYAPSNVKAASTDKNKLAKNRANTVLEFLKGAFPNLDKNKITINGVGTSTTSSCTSNERYKQDRRVDIIVKTAISGDDSISNPVNEITNNDVSNTSTGTTKTYKLNYNQYESDFFETKNITDDLVIKELQKKIKYFHPAFHSMTPEGFNSRLTFLNQCTRQGPTVGGTDSNSITATNLAFGRPPVCVLRIGDFYNTKIIITNLDINYEPLVWDLNPEGIGVQPMIADISLTFNFIGGSDLSGPIARLQNAVTSNFFANTGLFDNRSDSHSVIPDPDNKNYNSLFNPKN